MAECYVARMQARTTVTMARMLGVVGEHAGARAAFVAKYKALKGTLDGVVDVSAACHAMTAAEDVAELAGVRPVTLAKMREVRRRVEADLE